MQGAGRAIHTTDNLPNSTSAKVEEEEDEQTKNAEHRQSTLTPNTLTEIIGASFEFSYSIQIGRNRPKLIRDQSANTPGEEQPKTTCGENDGGTAGTSVRNNLIDPKQYHQNRQ